MSSAAGAGPRNVLVVHCHDLGRFLGCYGVTTVHTPHLDALADESTLFEKAFATAPHCSPARASLFTGAHPQTTGVLGLTHAPFGWDLTDPATHVAHRLSDLGYRTELVGVHHESRTLPDDEVAERLGFDRVRAGGARDAVVDNAAKALDDAAGDDRPFYLQIGFWEPHRNSSASDEPGVMGFLGEGFGPDSSLGVTVPAYLHDDEAARAELAELQGAVRFMDAGVGQVLAHLAALGLAEDTVVVFTTDHGLALPRAKCTLYDPGLEVALMVRVPGRPIWTGRRVPTMVSHVDVVPTLFDLLGHPLPSATAGVSLVPAVEDDGPGVGYSYGQLSYHTYYDPKRSVRSATHKLIANFGNAPGAMDPTQSWAHRTRPAVLVGPTIGTSVAFELYDLRHDPDEAVNLADRRHDDADLLTVFAQLAMAMVDWMREVHDPLLTPAPAGPRRHHEVLAALEGALPSARPHHTLRPTAPLTGGRTR